LRPRTLCERHRDLRIVVTNPRAAQVVIHADDLPFERLAARLAGNKFFHRDSFREWISFREITLHKVLVDERHAHAIRGVRLVETATTRDANAERLEVTGTRHHERGVTPFRRRRLAHDVEARAECGPKRR